MTRTRYAPLRHAAIRGLYAQNLPIVGLGGKKGSGKSTVGDYLVSRGFRTLAFADPFKRLVADVFGLSDEILWGSSEARDTTPAFEDFRPPAEVADDLRSLAHRERFVEILGAEREAEGRRQLAQRIEFWSTRPSGVPKVREVLQWVGTEWGQSFNPRLWVELALERARELQIGAVDYVRGNRVERVDTSIPAGFDAAPVVFTDVRSSGHEGRCIRDLGGLLLWMDAAERLAPSGDTHSSEPERAALAEWITHDIDRNGRNPHEMGAVDAILDAHYPRLPKPMYFTSIEWPRWDHAADLDHYRAQLAESLKIPKHLLDPNAVQAPEPDDIVTWASKMFGVPKEYLTGPEAFSPEDARLFQQSPAVRGMDAAFRKFGDAVRQIAKDFKLDQSPGVVASLGFLDDKRRAMYEAYGGDPLPEDPKDLEDARAALLPAPPEGGRPGRFPTREDIMGCLSIEPMKNPADPKDPTKP